MSIEEGILKSSRVMAVVGISAKSDRPSHRVVSYLKENGYTIIPVNPGVGEPLETEAVVIPLDPGWG